MKKGYWNVKKATLTPKPVQRPHPPVWIAGNSPKSTIMTGELGDGWLPAVTSPEMFEEDIKIIRDASEKAGRNKDAVEAGLFAYTSVSENYKQAKNAIEMFGKTVLMWSPRKLRRMGYNIDVGDMKITQFKFDRDTLKKMGEVMKQIPFEAVQKTTVFGTPDDCIEQIDKYIKAGVEHFVVSPMNVRMEDNIKLYGEKIIPYFREK